MPDADFRRVLVRIQAEFVEMPGLKLTLPQAARLWRLPSHVCRTALTSLVATGFLVETADEVFGRRGTPPVHVKAVDSSTWAVGPALPETPDVPNAMSAAAA